MVNCVILGRAEAFASKNTVGKSMLDALGMGFGFVIGLLSLGIVRELLGNGSIFGIPVFPNSFQEWVIMILPPGGFFTLAMWLMLFNYRKQKQAAS